MRKIILASQSPRRKELLSLAGFMFEVEPTDVDETLQGSNLQLALEDLALRKAQPLVEKHPEAIIIGADTIVVVDGVVLGKPNNDEEANIMLKQLSGKVHQVITAVALLHGDQAETFHTVNDVYFYALDDEMIRTYLSYGEHLDKAGAYGIQGKAAIFVEKIHGDFYSIVGLPIAELTKRLKNKV